MVGNKSADPLKTPTLEDNIAKNDGEDSIYDGQIMF